MPLPSPMVDPMFAEITKAIYGDVDPREVADLAKSMPGSSEVHIDGPLTEKEARRQKRVAQTGLAATGVATVAGLDATRTSIKEFRHRAAEGKEGRAVGPVARKLVRLKMSPKAAGLAVGTGLLGLHGVELASDALGAHAQTKALQQANGSIPKRKPVAKAFRLKPLNAMPIRVPSLRAKRVKLTPSPANPTTKAGLYQPVGKGLRSVFRAGKTSLRNVKSTTENARAASEHISGASEHAARAAQNASEATEKLNRLIPSRRTAVLLAGGAVGTLAGLPAAGSYAGSYAGNRRRNKNLIPVTKSAPVDVTWTGLISKVDTDKRQVFGWASVSAINGAQIVDLQGDIVPIEEMEKSAYRYVVESRKGGDMHKRVAKADEPLHTADMIESFVVTPEKLEKMGLPADSLPHGWWCGFHINDDAQWAMVKSGERKGFSIHGNGRRTPVSKRSDVDGRVSRLVARGDAMAVQAQKLHIASPRNHLLEKRDPVKFRALSRAPQLGVVNLQRTGVRKSARSASPPQSRNGSVASRSVPLVSTSAAELSDTFGVLGTPLVDGRLLSKVNTARAVVPVRFHGAHATSDAGFRFGHNENPSGAGRRTPVSKRERNRATVGGVHAKDPKPARAKLNPLYAPLHSSDPATKATNKVKLKLHRFTPEVNLATHFTPNILQAVGQQVYPLLKANRLEDIKDRTARKARRVGRSLQTRTDQAINPPAVKRHPVESTAIRSMGYQPQTRRLAVEMRSRPGQPYEYKMKTGPAIDALTAKSKGAHFATQIRGKAKRAEGYTPADRTRLFLKPQVSKAGPRELTSRPHVDTGYASEGFGANARPGTGRKGRRITSVPPRSAKDSARAFGHGARGGLYAETFKQQVPRNAKTSRKLYEHGYQRALHAEAAGSEHPRALRAGAHAGRAGFRVIRAAPPTVLGAALVTAGVKTHKDHLEADRRLAARRLDTQQSVSKLSTWGARGLMASAAAIPLAGGYLGYGVGTELNRRAYNKYGADLKPFEGLTHPIRAQYKSVSGATRKKAERQLRRAEKATKPRRAEIHRVRHDRYQEQADKYARKVKVSKAQQVYEPAVVGLPGDNRQAQMARSRRKTGLGLAGAGYLVSTRGKDIANEVASLGTRGAKKIGAARYAHQVAHKAKLIGHVTGKGGAVMVGTGLILAGEGAVADLHHRQQFARTHQEVKQKVSTLRKSAFGVDDYRIEKGFGSLLSGAAKPIMAGAGRVGARIKPVLPKLKPITSTPAGMRLTTAGKVGLGTVAGGTGIGLLGNGKLGKAFDPERSRHRRQDLYAGGAAGGTVVTGAGAAVAAREARRNRRAAVGLSAAADRSYRSAQSGLAAMSESVKNKGGPRTTQNIKAAAAASAKGQEQRLAAAKLAGRARKLTRVSGGLGLGAAALGAGAFGIHRSDRRGAGRSYGF